MKERDYCLRLKARALTQRVGFSREKAAAALDEALASTPLLWERDALRSARKTLQYAREVASCLP